MANMAGIDQSKRKTAASSPAEAPTATRERGWLLPSLLRTDTLLYGRWDYLADCWERGELPAAPLPPMPFLSVPDKATWAMLTASLDAIPQHGWAGWSGSEYFRFFLQWLLHGFGHAGHKEAPPEPAYCEGAGEKASQ